MKIIEMPLVETMHHWKSWKGCAEAVEELDIDIMLTGAVC